MLYGSFIFVLVTVVRSQRKPGLGLFSTCGSSNTSHPIPYPNSLQSRGCIHFLPTTSDFYVTQSFRPCAFLTSWSSALFLVCLPSLFFSLSSLPPPPHTPHGLIRSTLCHVLLVVLFLISTIKNLLLNHILERSCTHFHSAVQLSSFCIRILLAL